MIKNEEEKRDGDRTLLFWLWILKKVGSGKETLELLGSLYLEKGLW